MIAHETTKPGNWKASLLSHTTRRSVNGSADKISGEPAVTNDSLLEQKNRLRKPFLTEAQGTVRNEGIGEQATIL